jgi:hypothetical protein
MPGLFSNALARACERAKLGGQAARRKMAHSIFSSLSSLRNAIPTFGHFLSKREQNLTISLPGFAEEPS